MIPHFDATLKYVEEKTGFHFMLKINLILIKLDWVKNILYMNVVEMVL